MLVQHQNLRFFFSLFKGDAYIHYIYFFFLARIIIVYWWDVYLCI